MEGIYGNALAFTGEQEVRLADGNNLPVRGTNSYTMNVFVKVPQAPETLTYLAGFGNVLRTTEHIGESRGIIRYNDLIRDWGQGSTYDLSGSEDFDVNRWQMITSVYDGYTREKMLYKNGRLIGTKSMAIADTVAQAQLSPVLTDWYDLTGTLEDFKTGRVPCRRKKSRRCCRSRAIRRRHRVARA